MTDDESKREEYLLVLSHHPAVEQGEEAQAQGIGVGYFTLLEFVPEPTADISVGDRIPVRADEGTDPIATIRGRLDYDELTQSAEDTLPTAIRKIVMDNEERFVRVFNQAGPLTVRRHTLELLPGVGETIRDRVIEERRREPFDSLDEIATRVDGLSDPVDILIERIQTELSGEARYEFFIEIKSVMENGD